MQDKGGLRDTTTVTITVNDFDNLNPYFDHCLYKASIEENQVNYHRGRDGCLKHTNKTLFSVHAQVGLFSDVTPDDIKAEDGDTGINEPVVYSITTGTVNG